MTKEKVKSLDELRKEQIENEVRMKMKMEDFKKRVNEFLKEFEPLRKKFGIGLAANPKFIPDTAGQPLTYKLGADPIWVDASGVKEPTPEIPKAEEKEESAIKSS